jgi:hypothetical protein
MAQIIEHRRRNAAQVSAILLAAGLSRGRDSQNNFFL